MSSTFLWNKYRPDHDFGGKKVLNAGCGHCKLGDPNVLNMDMFESCKPDITWDLSRTPLPFHDKSFDLILANHIMEHLPDMWPVFEEFARILRPNGRIEIYVPAPGTDAVMGYRDHVREINQNSFFGTFQTFRAFGNAWATEHAHSPANWLKLVDRRIYMAEDKWLQVWPVNKLWMWCFKHLRNVASEVGYIFRKVTAEEFEEHQRMYEERQQGIRNENVRLFPLQKTSVR